MLAASRPDLLVVVGPADGRTAAAYPAGGHGSFRGFGVALDVTLGEPDPAAQGPALADSLAVGAWLLDRARWVSARRSRGSRWTGAAPPPSAPGPDRSWPPVPAASRSW
ncbi:protein of unknown function [Streptomyces sp. KY75]|nr:protein of unknown function [Streptomyces sp. KY75]